PKPGQLQFASSGGFWSASAVAEKLRRPIVSAMMPTPVNRAGPSRKSRVSMVKIPSRDPWPPPGDDTRRRGNEGRASLPRSTRSTRGLHNLTDDGEPQYGLIRDVRIKD